MHLSDNHSLHISERKPSGSTQNQSLPKCGRKIGKVELLRMCGKIPCLEGKENRSISPSGNQASDFCLFEQFFRGSGGGEIFSTFLISTQYHCVGLSGSLSDSILMFGVSRLSLLRSFYGSTPYTQKFDRKCGTAFVESILTFFSNL